MKNARELITEYGVTPNKALGQNFLIDESAIERIAAEASALELPVLEIGPGLGAITLPLAERVPKVAAVELDEKMCVALRKEAPDNVEVIHADFMKADLDDIHASLGGGDISVAGNLPYYITSPAVSRLVLSGLPVRRMTLMMQKEAADRFFAEPGDKNYVPLTVLCRRLFTVETVMELSPASYYPAPEVRSSVLRFDWAGKAMPARLPGLVKCAFAMRRKTVVNNLVAMGIKKDEAARILEKAGISPSARAESLTLADFEAIEALLPLG